MIPAGEPRAQMWLDIEGRKWLSEKGRAWSATHGLRNYTAADRALVGCPLEPGPILRRLRECGVIDRAIPDDDALGILRRAIADAGSDISLSMRDRWDDVTCIWGWINATLLPKSPPEASGTGSPGAAEVIHQPFLVRLWRWWTQ